MSTLYLWLINHNLKIKVKTFKDVEQTFFGGHCTKFSFCLERLMFNTSPCGLGYTCTDNSPSYAILISIIDHITPLSIIVNDNNDHENDRV